MPTDVSNIRVQTKTLMIMMKTNIPDTQPVAFTKSTLFLEEPMKTSSETLQIVWNYKYDEHKIVKLPYPEVVKLFFSSVEEFPDGIEPYLDISKENKKEDDPTFLYENTMITLRTLFPTSDPFPEHSNVIDTHSYSILGKRSSSVNFGKAVSDVLQQFTGFSGQNAKYSYLQIAGEKYTVYRTVWLRDLINHPLYFKYINRFKNFDEIFKKEQEQRQKQLAQMKKEFLKKYGLKWIVDKLSIIKKYFKDQLIKVDDRIKILNQPGFRAVNTEPDYIKNKLKPNLKFFLLFIDTICITSNDAAGNMIVDPKTNKIVVDNNSLFHNYEEIEEFVRLYEELTRTDEIKENNQILRQYINPPSSIQNELNEIKKKVAVVTKEENFVNKYFDEIVFSVDEEDKSELAKTIFYSQFSNNKDFIYPNRQSTNKDLQKIIDDYAASDSDTFQRFSKYILENYLGKKRHKMDSTLSLDLSSNVYGEEIMDVGVSLISKALATEKKENAAFSEYYEIYVELDLVRGMIDAKNKSQVFCPYYGSKLAKYIENKNVKKKPKYVLDVPELLSIQDAVAAEEKTKAEIKQPPSSEPKPAAAEKPVANPAVGGKTRRKKRIPKRRRTKNKRT